MSMAFVENEIRRILSTKQPEVVCISGHWGVGKTYAWNKCLEAAKLRSDGIGLGYYSYVSLFGINSLEDLRSAVFQNLINAADIGIEPSLESFRKNTIAVLKRLGMQAVPFLQYIPFARIPAGVIGPISYMWVKESLVCIDDIERRGDKLAARDVLGLISSLKETKQCKVVIILNDDAMASDKDRDDFATHSEKVIDIRLKFEPTAEESVHIALTTATDSIRLLGRHCITLGISNIRVIKKLERSVLGVEPLLKDFDEEIMRKAIQSIVLLGWSVLEPNRAPSLDYLKIRIPHYVSNQEKETPTAREAAWNALLDLYGFGSIDHFDWALLAGIQNGYFNADEVRKLAAEAEQRIRKAKKDVAYRQAWDLFHYSFDDNPAEVAEQMYTGFIENIDSADLVNINSTVQLLRELGKTDYADAILATYIEHNKNNRAQLDRRRNMFGGHVTDPTVMKALDDTVQTLKDEREPATVLLSMSQGWNPEDAKLLSSLDVEVYRKIFKAASGETLRRMIANALQFSVIVNAGEAEKEIARRAREALERIGRESPLNAIRVRKYGIVINPPASQ